MTQITAMLRRNEIASETRISIANVASDRRYRPLFSSARALLAFCNENGQQWNEKKENKQKTFKATGNRSTTRKDQQS